VSTAADPPAAALGDIRQVEAQRGARSSLGLGTATAQVLCRMFDAIEFRGKAQATVEDLAANSSVRVYNGLTDEWHPTQMLADFLTGNPAVIGSLEQLSSILADDGGTRISVQAEGMETR
jgi:ornithine carbamoyltransferase